MPSIDVAGATLSYTDTGGGRPPVLLLHAFPLNSRMWAGQVDALGDDYRVIAPDLKGFGSSDAPEDAGAYSMESYAAEVKRLLDSLEIPSAVVVGLSMGGYIAFALRRLHPDTVEALVLADTRAEADTPEAFERRTRQQQQVRTEGTRGLVDGMVGSLLGPATLQGRPDVVAHVRQLMDNPAAGFVGALEAMKHRPDSTPDLARIDVPCLILVGENDGLTPPAAARAMHERIRGSRLAVLRQAGHLSNLEAPEAFNGTLSDFVGDLEG